MAAPSGSSAKASVRLSAALPLSHAKSASPLAPMAPSISTMTTPYPPRTPRLRPCVVTWRTPSGQSWSWQCSHSAPPGGRHSAAAGPGGRWETIVQAHGACCIQTHSWPMLGRMRCERYPTQPTPMICALTPTPFHCRPTRGRQMRWLRLRLWRQAPLCHSLVRTSNWQLQMATETVCSGVFLVFEVGT
jgi:hypothetical protein